MKPIVLTQNEEGQIILTMEEFEKIIDSVYAEGKKDGFLSIPYISTNHVTNPPTIRKDNNWKDYATCSSSTLKTKSDSPSEDGRWGD